MSLYLRVKVTLKTMNQKVFQSLLDFSSDSGDKYSPNFNELDTSDGEDRPETPVNVVQRPRLRPNITQNHPVQM